MDGLILGHVHCENSCRYPGQVSGPWYMGLESRVWAKAEAWEFRGVDGLTPRVKSGQKGEPRSRPFLGTSE